jgi:O-antigen ligase
MFKWLLFLIIYLPFQIAINPGAGFDLASLRVFIVLLFIIWLRKIWKDRSRIWKRCFQFQGISLFLFLILAAFSLINAQNPIWGVRKIIFLISIFPLYFLVVSLVDNWFKIKKVVLALVIGSGALALIGLVQFLTQFIFGLEKVYSFWAMNILPVFSGFNFGAMILAYPSWLVNVNGQTMMRAFSLFSDPHIFSFYLGLTIPLLIILLKSSPKRVFFCGFYCLLVVSLLFSFTRGAYLALIITFLVLAGLIWKYLEIKKLALLFLLTLLIFIIPGTLISDRFYSSFDLTEGSNLGRLEMWQQAGQAGWEYFWQGVGLGNYSLMVNSSFGYRNPVTAHNFYLDIFSEMGVFTLIVWLVLILGTIGQLFQRLRKPDKPLEQKYVLIGLIGSLVYLSIHSFFETPIYNSSLLALLMIILGLSSKLSLYASKDN